MRSVLSLSKDRFPKAIRSVFALKAVRSVFASHNYPAMSKRMKQSTDTAYIIFQQ